MQKKLIALAIAGLASTGAFAQTNVTIYGVADVGYTSVTSSVRGGPDLEFRGLTTGVLSGSRLGFKAEEDLGGGLKAGALYEFGTLAPDGGGASSAGTTSGMGSIRQSYVFLSGSSWGTVQAGRIYTAGTNTFGKFDAEGSSFFGAGSRLNGTAGIGSTIDAGSDRSRLNNSVAWLSPNWSGFSGQVQYSWGEQGNATVGTTNDSRYWGGGIDYTNGPLAVAFAYNDFSDYTGQTVGAASRDLNEWIIGGSYDFGMLKLTGSYQDFDGDNMATIGGAAAAGASVKGDIWQIGVIVPVMKAGSVRVTYADLSRDTRATRAAAKTSADADGWSLSYQHAMSKRTTLYVGYTEVSNNRGSTVSVGAAGAPSAGQDSSGYAMGMRHTF